MKLLNISELQFERRESIEIIPIHKNSEFGYRIAYAFINT